MEIKEITKKLGKNFEEELLEEIRKERPIFKRIDERYSKRKYHINKKNKKKQFEKFIKELKEFLQELPI